MTEKEVQEIYSRLLELTRTGAIQWKKTGDYEYTANFSRSSVAIGKVRGGSEPVFTMWIINEDGIVVARVSSIELGEEEGVKEFILDTSELFNLAQEKVYKYSETSENILNELRKLKAS